MLLSHDNVTSKVADFQIDHHLLVKKICIKLAKTINRYPFRGSKIDLKKLKNDTIAAKFEGSIVQTLKKFYIAV